MIVGFRVLYARREEGFACLELAGCRLMLDQIDGGSPARRGIWDTGALQRPYGRGINFEIQVADLDAALAGVRETGLAIFFGPEERWYRVEDQELGVRQVLVQDPDGYLVRLQQVIGQRLLRRGL